MSANQALIVIGVVLYVLLPLDLLPDMFGPLGRIDDILFAVGAFFLLRNKQIKEATKESKRAAEGSNTKGEPSREQPNSSAPSPYEVLDVASDAPMDDIERAYKQLLTKYHPDKVSHLGEELQTTAHRKTLEIRDAYERIIALRRA